jgi:hypothetical protein
MDRIRIAATFTRAGMAAGLEELVNQARKTGWGILEALTPKVRYAL